MEKAKIRKTPTGLEAYILFENGGKSDNFISIAEGREIILKCSKLQQNAIPLKDCRRLNRELNKASYLWGEMPDSSKKTLLWSSLVLVKELGSTINPKLNIHKIKDFRDSGIILTTGGASLTFISKDVGLEYLDFLFSEHYVNKEEFDKIKEDIASSNLV